MPLSRSGAWQFFCFYLVAAVAIDGSELADKAISSLRYLDRYQSVHAVPLGGGLSNRNFILNAVHSEGEEKLVLRVPGDFEEETLPLEQRSFAKVHTIDRATEHLIAKHAHAAGLSPELLELDNATGASLARFVPHSSTLTREILVGTQLPLHKRFMNALVRLHSIPLPDASMPNSLNALEFNPLARAKQRVSWLKQEHGEHLKLPTLASELLALCSSAEELLRASLARFPRLKAIVHTDVTPANFLVNDETPDAWVVDFESAPSI